MNKIVGRMVSAYLHIYELQVFFRSYLCKYGSKKIQGKIQENLLLMQQWHLGHRSNAPCCGTLCSWHISGEVQNSIPFLSAIKHSFTGVPNKVCPRLRDSACWRSGEITQPRTSLIREPCRNPRALRNYFSYPCEWFDVCSS